MINKIVETAKEAGKEILEIYGSGDFGVSFKDDSSPLTKADMASNEIITDGLKKISGLPVVSEEADVEYDVRKNWEYFWLVDPLDGTKDFIARNGQFTVNIALVHSNKPVLGVIYIPVLGAAYWAESGGGAYREIEIYGSGDSQAAHISGCVERIYNLSRRTDLIASDSVFHSSAETKNFLEKNNITRIKRFGSSLKYCRLAEGEIDIYPRFNGTKEWDTAAGQVILSEAGCKIMDLKTKQNLKYNKPDIRNNFFIAMRGDLEVDCESYCIGGGAGNAAAPADGRPA
ncbi:MAG: 3'(2'),5'-bisphosphate nucleotidase CysQ [Spirochaetaceae bacterium]|jgi:3'(2'), 5'-bisphosphate nucleotidase|nr:3'(2'),5'-bisphosphate nucleotidase CysQ [Spirochaetaceae bacterium]